MRLSIIICSIITASSYIFAPPKKDNSKNLLSKSKQEKKVKKNNDDDLLDGILNSAEHQEAVKKAEKEASYNQANNNQAIEAFFKAIVVGDVASCQSLLDKGLNINNVVDKEQYTALHYAITTKSILDEQIGNDMIDFLLIHGANVNAANNPNRSPLMAAVEQNQNKILQKLIAYGANVNAQNAEKTTALTYAAYCNYLSCLETLIKAGAKDLQISKGCTALMVAIAEKHIEAAQMLIKETNFDLDLKDERNYTALCFAVGLTLPTVVESLLARNVKCNIFDKDGNTLLAVIFKDKEHEILDDDKKKIAQMLLLHGADPTLTHSGIFHALAYAKKHKQDELAQLIRKCGCEKIEEKNKAILLQKSFQTLVDHRNYKRTERLEKKRIENASACQALEQKNKIVTLRECYRKLFDYRRNLPPDSIPNKIWADLRDEDDEQRFLKRDE